MHDGESDARRSLKQRALALLARRAYTRAALAERLARPSRRRGSDGKGDAGRRVVHGRRGHTLADQSGERAADAGALYEDRAPTAEDIASVLDDLERAGLIDDAAYAATFAEQSLRRRPESRERLAARLRSRGVPRDIAERAAVEAAGEDHARDLARRALEQIWPKCARLGDEAAVRRAGAYLTRRGFPAEVASQVIEERMKMA